MLKKAIPLIINLFLIGCASTPEAQDAADTEVAAPNEAPAATPPPPSSVKAVPQNFRRYAIGDSLDSVQATLKNDTDFFDYKGPADVSLLPSANQSILEVRGKSIADRAIFQFYKGKLWTIIVFLKPNRVDHYSVYTDLVQKYGAPQKISPTEIRWEDKNMRMSLERPLTLRYVDMLVLAELNNNKDEQKKNYDSQHKDFFDGL